MAAQIVKVNYNMKIYQINQTPKNNINLINKMSKTVNSNSIQMVGNYDLSIIKLISKGMYTRYKFICPDYGQHHEKFDL